MTDELVKIQIRLKRGGGAENLYAMKLPNGNFILDNIPFYAYGISYGDEVRVSEVSGKRIFDGVVRSGGHSTYRTKLRAGATHEDFLKKWLSLSNEKCGFEGSGLADRRLYAIDVSPGADIDKVYDWLVKGEEEGIWEFEEGHYAGPVQPPN